MSFTDTRISRLDARSNVARIWTTPMARSRPSSGLQAAPPHVISRSPGGAISVTRSRTRVLFGSGFTVMSRASSRVVQA
jgi:hypothetical protein